ncbi:hypothetical protein KIL84_011188 [Mauremys mutica]|uniref:Uncharacterized protein n=1 Tax=Mauremys mutica TaxID=74926 RepID=A0A9D3XD67_9SAUR|nr:hypothetical protein KIL84_011188 [Mauremys mutica]
METKGQALKPQAVRGVPPPRTATLTRLAPQHGPSHSPPAWPCSHPQSSSKAVLAMQPGDGTAISLGSSCRMWESLAQLRKRWCLIGFFFLLPGGWKFGAASTEASYNQGGWNPSSLSTGLAELFVYPCHLVRLQDGAQHMPRIQLGVKGPGSRGTSHAKHWMQALLSGAVVLAGILHLFSGHGTGRVLSTGVKGAGWEWRSQTIGGWGGQ